MSEHNNRTAEQNKYPQIVSYLRETPWAIRETTLAAIMDMVAHRATGLRFTAEEIEARIGAGPAARQGYIAANNVAVIPIYGVITPRADLMTEMSGGTSIQRFKATLEAAMADGKITSILLDINSPGGSTDLVPEMATQIRQARRQKPIVALANTDAASAAYWLGSQASEFVVTPSGSVGSIGVFAAHTDVSAAEKMEGFKTTLISAGKYKTEFSPFQPLSDDAKAELQSKVDKFYVMFTQDVARGRSTTVEAVRDGYGQGRMVTGRDAVTAGMVDRVDTFDNVLAYMTKSTAGPSPTRAATVDITVAAQADPPSDPDRPDEPDTNTFQVAHSGLSFTDEADQLRDSAEALVERTHSLAEFRDRGNLTVSKRERLAACSEALRESHEAIQTLLRATTPNTHLAAALAEQARYEQLKHERQLA